MRQKPHTGYQMMELETDTRYGIDFGELVFGNQVRSILIQSGYQFPIS